MAASPVEYLYVDANEGGSSGGHAALRVGDRVFHFEYVAPGLLRAHRASAAGFERQYTRLENRTIEVQRLDLDAAASRRLGEHFSRLHLVQTQQFETLAALRAERRLLEAMTADAAGVPARVTIEGAGLFFEDEAGAGRPSTSARGPAGPTSPAIAALSDRIGVVLGGDFLDRRTDEVRGELARLDPRVEPAPLAVLSESEMPPPWHGFARRYLEGVTALRALDVLRTARAPRPDVLVVSDRTDLALTPAEVETLDGLVSHLEASLVRLVASSRPDWGLAALIGMARLAALEETRRSGSWAVLDAFPDGATVVAHERLARRPDLLRAALSEGRADFAAARAHLFRSRPPGAAFPEAALADLEAAGNRVLEAVRASVEGRDLRVGPSLPSRGAGHADLALPGVEASALRESLAAGRAREGAYLDELMRLYRYHLLTRNCVTEIFREMDTALAGAGRSPRPGPLAFIPFVAAATVGDLYPVTGRSERPSYRKQRLAQMYGLEPSLRVFLRESNTLTSTVYRPAAEDSPFLFFTDDAVLARPLFGLANLVTGLGVTLAGVARLPADGGATVWAGLRAMVFSLPELVFFNIRKGTFEYVERPP